MKLLKILVRLLAAEILCLFINMTFAGSSNPLVRCICLVCTVMILILLLADFSIKEASRDTKSRKAGKSGGIISAGIFASLPFFVSWLVLVISAKCGGFDYYPWHKLLNQPFLQLYALISSSISAYSLSVVQLAVMLTPVTVPAFAVIIPYFFSHRGDSDI